MTVDGFFRRVAASAVAGHGRSRGWRHRRIRERVCVEGATSHAGGLEEARQSSAGTWRRQSWVVAAGSNGGDRHHWGTKGRSKFWDEYDGDGDWGKWVGEERPREWGKNLNPRLPVAHVIYMRCG
jgi:hypothetical protein